MQAVTPMLQDSDSVVLSYKVTVMGVVFFVATDNERLRFVTPCHGSGYMSGSRVLISSDNPHVYNIHIAYKLLGLVQKVLDE